MTGPGKILSEIRRRHVFRVVGLYIVAAWGVHQVCDLAFQSWGLPDDALRHVWIALFVLFPLVVFFGWRYDLTAQGIVRTPPASGQEDLSLQSTDFTILATLLVVAAIGTWWTADKISTTQPGSSSQNVVTDINPFSIAVLPFATRSSTEDTVFFADGIHDDLLTTLSKIIRLKVISRTSVLEYRDTAKKIPNIARELGVAFILEGGVQQAGSNVRINVQLIDARTDDHVWANTYDRALSVGNIFAIQSEIVETIADQLKANMSSDEREQINKNRTDNLDAFREYTYGRQQVALSSFEALRKATEHFRAAITFDPNFVTAYAALANTYAALALVGAITPKQMMENGRQYIDRAMELDEDDPFVMAVQGRYLAVTDDPRADEVMRNAVAAAPNNVDVLNIYATYLRRQRRGEEALVILRQALDLDPLSVLLYHDLGRVHLWMGQFEPALAAFDRISQINPGNPYAAHGAGMATILSGQLVKAAHWSDQAMQIDPADFENHATSAQVYASYGDLETAQQRVDEGLAIGPDEPYPLSSKALLLAIKGEKKRSIAVARSALAKGLEDRWGSHAIFLRLVRDDAMDSGEYDEAITWYRKYEPELFASPPDITANNIRKAPDLALLLRQTGSEKQADTLLHVTINTYNREYTLGSANFPLGIAIVDALALLGRDDEAIAKLRELFNDGWRTIWQFDTMLNRNHDSLRDNDAYKAILEDIRADLRAQASELS